MRLSKDMTGLTLLRVTQTKQGADTSWVALLSHLLDLYQTWSLIRGSVKATSEKLLQAVRDALRYSTRCMPQQQRSAHLHARHAIIRKPAGQALL